MGLEANKELVLTALRHWGEEPMFDLLDDGIVFTNFVDPNASEAMAQLGTPLASKEGVIAAFRRARDVIPEGYKRTIRWVTAEDDRVVVEDSVRGSSPLRPDRPFRLCTLKVFHLKDGKIVRINRTLDSWYCEDYSPQAIARIYAAAEG